MFFNIKPLPPAGIANTDAGGETRVTHNTGYAHVIPLSKNI